MPSVLDQKFKFSLSFNKKQSAPIEKYLENQIGPRTYWLRSRIGGKKWVIKSNYFDSNITVELDDENHASFLALKFA